ncbi:MAG: DUF2380 domain-containing protein [Gemmatimonadota bacterium]
MRVFFAVLCLLPLSLSAAGGAPPAPLLEVAIVDLTIVDNSYGGDSDELAEWLRDQEIDPTRLLREAIVRTETYAAFDDAPLVESVPEPRVAGALAEAGTFAAACHVDCALTVGRTLGADRVITGEVTKLSTLIWFVTARVVDVKSGKVLRQDELEVKGVIQDMMPQVMASLSRRMVLAG